MTHTITLSEEQRQMILLALAQLSLERPGWHETLGETAECFPGGREMYEEFRLINNDVPCAKLAAMGMPKKASVT